MDGGDSERGVEAAMTGRGRCYPFLILASPCISNLHFLVFLVRYRVLVLKRGW